MLVIHLILVVLLAQQCDFFFQREIKTNLFQCPFTCCQATIKYYIISHLLLVENQLCLKSLVHQTPNFSTCNTFRENRKLLKVSIGQKCSVSIIALFAYKVMWWIKSMSYFNHLISIIFTCCLEHPHKAATSITSLALNHLHL